MFFFFFLSNKFSLWMNTGKNNRNKGDFSFQKRRKKENLTVFKHMLDIRSPLFMLWNIIHIMLHSILSVITNRWWWWWWRGLFCVDDWPHITPFITPILAKKLIGHEIESELKLFYVSKISTFHKNNPVISLGQQLIMQFTNRYTKTSGHRNGQTSYENKKYCAGCLTSCVLLLLTDQRPHASASHISCPWVETLKCTCFSSSELWELDMLLMLCHKFKMCLALHTRLWANSGCLCLHRYSTRVCVCVCVCIWEDVAGRAREQDGEGAFVAYICSYDDGVCVCVFLAAAVS